MISFQTTQKGDCVSLPGIGSPIPIGKPFAFRSEATPSYSIFSIYSNGGMGALNNTAASQKAFCFTVGTENTNNSNLLNDKIRLLQAAFFHHYGSNFAPPSSLSQPCSGHPQQMRIKDNMPVYHIDFTDEPFIRKGQLSTQILGKTQVTTANFSGSLSGDPNSQTWKNHLKANVGALSQACQSERLSKESEYLSEIMEGIEPLENWIDIECFLVSFQEKSEDRALFLELLKKTYQLDLLDAPEIFSKRLAEKSPFEQSLRNNAISNLTHLLGITKNIRKERAHVHQLLNNLADFEGDLGVEVHLRTLPTREALFLNLLEKDYGIQLTDSPTDFSQKILEKQPFDATLGANLNHNLTTLSNHFDSHAPESRHIKTLKKIGFELQSELYIKTRLQMVKNLYKKIEHWLEHLKTEFGVELTDPPADFSFKLGIAPIQAKEEDVSCCCDQCRALIPDKSS